MCQSGYQGRRYYTQEEKKSFLEDYAKDLENELKAVKERLVEIKA